MKVDHSSPPLPNPSRRPPVPSHLPPPLPVPPDSSPLYGVFLPPIAHLTAIPRILKGNRRFLKCDPSWLSQGQLFTVEKSPSGIQPDWQPLLRKGKSARDLVACGLLPHLLPLLPKGGSCVSWEHDTSCPKVKRSDCTPRCFAVKSCLQKLNRRPQHKQDIHSWQTAATRKPEWTEQEWIMLRLNPTKFECKTKLNRIVYWTSFKRGKNGEKKKNLYFSLIPFYTELYNKYIFKIYIYIK